MLDMYKIPLNMGQFGRGCWMMSQGLAGVVLLSFIENNLMKNI